MKRVSATLDFSEVGRIVPNPPVGRHSPAHAVLRTNLLRRVEDNAPYLQADA
jgi:hypothetical protein